MKYLSFLQPHWLIVIEIIYVLFVIAVCLRIVWDTRSVGKTLAYLLLVFFVPIVGIIIYFSFGINYRKRKIYNKKLIADDVLLDKTMRHLMDEHELYKKQPNILPYKGLVNLLTNVSSGNFSPIFGKNKVEILENGEQLFPEIKAAILAAKHHIHIQFYIYENDAIGNELKDLMVHKAKEGVQVRFIYDDFGSKNIRRNIVPFLKKNGVEAYPFNKIKLMLLANRLNYRNHRKIVIIDGCVSFIGGINVCDKYINHKDIEKLYWRDTHIKITGAATNALQHVFLSDWNFCSKQQLGFSYDFFPELKIEDRDGFNSDIQIVASGPDSDTPAILHAVMYAMAHAQKEIYITTPYYIPDDQLQQLLIMTAQSGISINMLIPMRGDSWLIDVVAQAYFEELLKAGVKIFRYTKGFVHAKTFIIDGTMCSVGTANFDLRSFDLNFEVTALLYDEKHAQQMKATFEQDIQDAQLLDLEKWQHRPKWTKLIEKVLRLLSPLM